VTVKASQSQLLQMKAQKLLQILLHTEVVEVQELLKKSAPMETLERAAIEVMGTDREKLGAVRMTGQEVEELKDMGKMVEGETSASHLGQRSGEEPCNIKVARTPDLQARLVLGRQLSIMLLMSKQ